MMSVPSTISRFKLEASASWGSTMAGRKFANAFRPDLKASSPRSGRCSAGNVSHLYLKVRESDDCERPLVTCALVNSSSPG